MTDIDAVIYARLCTAAEHGQPCPSNRGMAALVPFGTEYTVKCSIKRLVADKRIYVVSSPHSNVRKVTIVGAGMETGWSRRADPATPKQRDRERPPQLEPDKLPPNCFAAHNIEPGDWRGAFSAPETWVPAKGVLE